jgi:hypothetical protein
VNRKQWIIAGIILVLFVVGFLTLPRAGSGTPQEKVNNSPAAELVYCADEQSRPCVVSFSVDSDENMLVNLLLPADRSFPSFYLKIIRGSSATSYACRWTDLTAGSAYCTGPKQLPGETLTFQLISAGDETLLAQGDLSIIGLAFPTLGIAVVTPMDTLTMLPIESPAPTASLLVLPPTQTPPSYPGPSYPNPSYP